MKIGIVLGTRPEIIKMSSLIDEINKHDDECVIIHTGQHFDDEMSKQFFIDLNLPLPDYNIGIGSNTAIKQISIIISELEKILIDEKIDIVLVQGDTNAVLAGALAANKLKIPVGHVEAGLRSFDKDMPEENNRIIADNCSSLFFVPTKENAINLQNEGINHKDIHVTGNTIVDACKRNLKIAIEKSGVKDIIKYDKYIVLTLHRAENVDNPERLKNIVRSLLKLEYNIVFPLHPHTKKSLEENDLYEQMLKSSHIQITKPLGYLDFLYLLSKSSLVLTDSGGIQEESITLNIPCVTLRYNTERPETISAGGNILAGTEEKEIKYNIESILNNEEVYEKMANAVNPYGNGDSSEKIYSIIKDAFENNRLKIKSSDTIVDFEGYLMKNITNDITVEEFENENKNQIIEQIFYNGLPEFIDEKTNLKNNSIIIKKLKQRTSYEMIVMNFDNKQIGIFGLGHIGLPTAAILANNNIHVLGADVNENTVNNINQGICNFEEPGLNSLVKDAVKNNYLSATTDLEYVANTCDIIIVIVPTPIFENKKADLTYVISACESIKKGLKKGNLVIIESTVPPETGINVIKPLLEESGLICGEDFYLSYSPERALPNNTIYEMTHNARIIGGFNEKSADLTAQLYSYITQGEIIKVKNITSAEMVKLMENTYRDVNIALSNELAKICEKINVNANEVINAANYHPRVNLHTPGPGVGGHCIPIDPYFLIEIAEKYGETAKLISDSRLINDSMPDHVLNILSKFNDGISTVSILGIAYKGNVDDVRETPSKKLIELLIKNGYRVVANDPIVKKEVIETFNVDSVSYEDSLKSDCIIIMTDHDMYKELKPEQVKDKLVISTKPILDSDKFREAGINFQAIGDIVL